MITLLAVISFAAAYAWAVAHQLILGWIFASMVERLPPPDTTSGKVYAYIYSVLQLFAANTRRTQDAVTVARTPKP